jgi:2-dehydropantoate 2-reductase
MAKPEFKILVVGAGAIGGITAALLKKNGADVEIVCKYDDYASLISNTGVEVSGVCGRFNMKIPAYASIPEVIGKKDIILLATKATDMIGAAQSIKAILKENAFLISLQNGICEDALAAVVGRNRVIGCVTGWGATMSSRGKLEMTSEGDFIIGYTDRPSDNFLLQIAGLLSAVVPVRTTDNIMGHLYSKLIINSCITSLGAVCGLYLGKMLLKGKIRRIFIELVREAVDVAERLNIKIEVFAGKLDFKEFLKGKSVFSTVRRHLLLLVIGFKYRKLKSSSLQSLERGRQTEIDFLNGYIATNAVKVGVLTPVNDAIIKMIHQIELKKRKITVSNFDDPFFDRFTN